ncbi:hypothetical protein [Nonomuraea rubra]
MTTVTSLGMSSAVSASLPLDPSVDVAQVGEWTGVDQFHRWDEPRVDR